MAAAAAAIGFVRPPTKTGLLLSASPGCDARTSGLLQCRKPRTLTRIVAESYRKGGGGASDFFAGFGTGFVLGGAIFGALGYLLAPEAVKSFKLVKENGKALPNKPTRFVEDDPRLFEDDDETLEKTRRSLREKILQLNEKLDSVSAQLSTEN